MSDQCQSVYVVDDDASVRESVEGLIRTAGLRVESFASPQEFLNRCCSKLPSCLVLDMKLPGMSGLEVQGELAKADVHVPIIFLTGHGNIEMSVQAMKSGALDFFTKPLDSEALLVAIRDAIDHYSEVPNSQNNGSSNDSHEMIGTGSAFEAAVRQVALVAPTDSTVLILGETGTGKELAARAIHARSNRSSGPMVSVNCAAIQPSLIASELFGHEKGAFTGALHRRLGRFELAKGGTIFLDEIGDLPLETQIGTPRIESLPIKGSETPIMVPKLRMV